MASVSTASTTVRSFSVLLTSYAGSAVPGTPVVATGDRYGASACASFAWSSAGMYLRLSDALHDFICSQAFIAGKDTAVCGFACDWEDDNGETCKLEFRFG